MFPVVQHMLAFLENDIVKSFVNIAPCIATEDVLLVGLIIPCFESITLYMKQSFKRYLKVYMPAIILNLPRLPWVQTNLIMQGK